MSMGTSFQTESEDPIFDDTAGWMQNILVGDNPSYIK